MITLIAAALLYPLSQVHVNFDDFPFVEDSTLTAELIVKTHVTPNPFPMAGVAVIGPSLLDPPDPGGVIYEPPLGSIVFGATSPDTPDSIGVMMLSTVLSSLPLGYPPTPGIPAYIPWSWVFVIHTDANGQWTGAVTDPPTESFSLYLQFAFLESDGTLSFTPCISVELP